jgi:hypothetical protein
MTAQIIRAREVTRPTTTPLISSILDHATVVDNAQFGYRNNAGLFDSYNCLDTLVPTPTCANPLIEMDYKTFSVAGWAPGFEFAVHGGVKCSLIGLDRDEQKRELERVFALNEGKGVEAALIANRFVDNNAGSDDGEVSPYNGIWDAPVDLNTTGASVGGAMAALESYAASVYAGVPTLHMPRGAVLLAFGQGLITERDGKFFTKTGAKVAAGGGYDDPDSVWSGSFDLYATGEVYVEKSATISHSAVVVPGDGSGTGSEENGLGDNTGVALVERMFRAAVDCFVAKATGSGGLASGGGDGGFGN